MLLWLHLCRDIIEASLALNFDKQNGLPGQEKGYSVHIDWIQRGSQGASRLRSDSFCKPCTTLLPGSLTVSRKFLARSTQTT